MSLYKKETQVCLCTKSTAPTEWRREIEKIALWRDFELSEEEFADSTGAIAFT